MAKKPQPAVIAYAIEKAGGLSELARQLGVKRQAVFAWKRIPAERARKVSEITGIPLADLRPDLYEGVGQ